MNKKSKLSNNNTNLQKTARNLVIGNLSTSYILAMIGGALSLFLGVTVLFGWYTHNVTLIQVSAAFVPMQFNTALGFLLGGLGLLLIIKKRHRVGLACGIIVMFIGLLTLTEYIFGIGIGIDQLLMQHYITTQTSHPGRMAPNTALCFSLTGIALVVFSNTLDVWKSNMVVAVLGSLIIGLAIVALTGYTTNIEAAYGWGNLTRMAIHTAIGLLLLGLALYSLVWHQSVSDKSKIPSWFPVSVGIGVFTLMISLWQAFVTQEEKLMTRGHKQGL